MRLLMLINKVENRIHAGEAYVAEELAAFYSGLHSIYENIRLPLESELQALEHIADRIFSVGSGVPPSPTTAETAGEATTSVGIPIASIAPAEISAPEASLVTPASGVGASEVAQHEELQAAVEQAPEAVQEEIAMAPEGSVHNEIASEVVISAPDAELHKLADDGNPHHDDDEGHPELA